MMQSPKLSIGYLGSEFDLAHSSTLIYPMCGRLLSAR